MFPNFLFLIVTVTFISNKMSHFWSDHNSAMELLGSTYSVLSRYQLEPGLCLKIDRIHVILNTSLHTISFLNLSFEAA